MQNSPPHIILGISPDASDNEIKKTFRQLAKKWHPDRYRGSKEYGEEQFKRIKLAHETMLSTEYRDNRKMSSQLPSYHNPSGQNYYQTNQTNQTNQQVNQTYQPNIFTNPYINQNINYQQIPRQYSRFPTTAEIRNPPRQSSASVLCNGTVLLSGDFHPSQMTPGLLRHLQNRGGR